MRSKAGPIEFDSTDALVEEFERICLDQYECLLDRKIARYNRLVYKIISIRE
jgi:hypothetical protein